MSLFGNTASGGSGGGLFGGGGTTPAGGSLFGGGGGGLNSSPNKPIPLAKTSSSTNLLGSLGGGAGLGKPQNFFGAPASNPAQNPAGVSGSLFGGG